MTSRRDTVTVSRQELEHLRTEVAELEQMIGEIVKRRIELSELEETINLVLRKHVDMRMLRMRLDAVLAQKEDPDKTPVRPPSQQDMKAAFKTSGEFEAVKPRGRGGTAEIPTVDPNDPTRKK